MQVQSNSSVVRLLSVETATAQPRGGHYGLKEGL